MRLSANLEKCLSISSFLVRFYLQFAKFRRVCNFNELVNCVELKFCEFCANPKAEESRIYKLQSIKKFSLDSCRTFTVEKVWLCILLCVNVYKNKLLCTVRQQKQLK